MPLAQGRASAREANEHLRHWSIHVDICCGAFARVQGGNEHAQQAAWRYRRGEATCRAWVGSYYDYDYDDYYDYYDYCDYCEYYYYYYYDYGYYDYYYYYY